MIKTKTAEAVQGGIIATLVDEYGEVIERNLIQYADAIRSLDRGDYDRHNPSGLKLAAAILEGEAAGFYKPDSEHRAVFWRWLVADIFIRTMAEENGVAEVQNESGGIDRPAVYIGKHGGISVYPFAERFSLASHIEAIAIEKCGVNDGYLMAVNIYKSMVDANFSLSKWGREALETLHDSFIERLNTDGIPTQPVTH